MNAAGGASPAPDYESELRDILAARDWERLRDFSRDRNAIPDDVYAQPQHFWEVMLHKLTCGRLDLLGCTTIRDAGSTNAATRPISAGIKRMTVRVVPFARIREIVGRAEFELAAHDGATAGELWAELAATYPSLDGLRASTRLVRNGEFVDASAALRDGDELGLLPPFGGG
jgi:molybdopterin converting factor small subunit